MDEQQRINAVASSSNFSSMVSSKTYDVFLSFRGEDTRLNFTSHLYKALNEENVDTYIDNRLEKGDEISAALTKAIEDSHVSIVIFSENYASSKWCLGELSKILECKKFQGQIVIPVFYGIDPSHVRKQTGSYGQAFAKHGGDPRCYKWRDDLTEAANLAGWDSRNRTEAEFLEDIVEDVLQKLAPRYPNQRKGLVGIEGNYAQVESKLKNGSSEIKTHGIWGMGGIGKTTLATALYDKLSYEFEGHCFLANVREKSDKLETLRDELFSKLFGNKSHSFDTYEMSRLLQRKRVFIVLDDVATSEQLEKLIYEYDFLGPGSRVIVTTRNKQILGPVDEIYPVQELSSVHSLQLFCLTSFGEKQPKDGYEDLSRRVISYCKGIPLALKVLGASLRSRSKEAWECELGKLQKIPNMEIHKVLKLSYDGLDRSQQDIFLDIACFFKGWRRNRITSLLEACDLFAASGIEVLLDKALIISNGNQIEMHDLIQEMGWEIVHQESMKNPGRRSRLWKHEEVQDVLKYNKGTEVVEGITLDLSKLTEDLYLSSDFLAKMTNVRFLKIHRSKWGHRFNVYIPNGLDTLSNKLRYLYWDECCLKSLPSNFCGEQLVELRMCASKLKKLWDGVQNLVNLMTIDLSYSRDLIEIPDVSKAEKLTYLDFRGCRKIESLNVHSKFLSELHLDGCSSLKEISVASEEMTQLNLSETGICALSSSMLSLPKLTCLDLSGCTKLENLNVHLKSLLVLRLNGCSSLKEISVASEEITQLKLSGTGKCALSSSMLSLPKLTRLDLSGCRNIESLSVHLKSLLVLRLSGCSSLKEFSVTSEEMRELDLSHTAIHALSSSMLSLPKLNELSLSGFVESLNVHLKSLQVLRLNGCSSLKELSVTSEEMIELVLSDATIRALSLNSLSDTTIYLDLRECKEIESLNVHSKSLHSFSGGYSSLKEISVTSEEMTKLDLRAYREIEILKIHSKSLSGLDLDGCSSLKEFSVTSEEMKWLNLSNTAICSLPSSISQLLSIEVLILSGTNVESLPANIINLSMLTMLYLTDCRKLTSLPELPPSLYVLGAINCILLETEITQRLVLQHMLKSRIPFLHQQYLDNPQYFDNNWLFMFPGDHVSDECEFRTTGSSITIPYLPKSHLLGFISCLILSMGPVSYHSVSSSIYQDDIYFERDCSWFTCWAYLISNHVLFQYHDVSKFDRINEVYDHFRDISFAFQYYDDTKYVNDQERIKGCGVFPVYATTWGLKLVSSSSKEIFEWETIAEISGR